MLLAWRWPGRFMDRVHNEVLGWRSCHLMPRQLMREPPDLNLEVMPSAADDAEIAVAHQDALRGLLPIHAVDLDQRVVEKAGD